MAYEQKTRPGSANVGEFLAAVEDPDRRRDCETLVEMMQQVAGKPPVLWGSMIGFGQYHYRYPTGTEGDAFLIGFSPRKSDLSIYLMGTLFSEEAERRAALLAKLGKHRMGKACLYVKRLSDIDLDVLRELAEISVTRLRATYPAQT
ncbi:MAG TPA: DUF1801 domain-containing protein [Devosia sp.]|jgi:hypothetical protein|nr:DUF1801 domain-containing protein [Devosia sp.]